MKTAPSGLVNEEIAMCLKFGAQRSFLVPAGAGAGKTSALTNAIRNAISINAASLYATGAQIGAITYTRAAASEILSRLDHDPRVWVSTVHSFAWEMIKRHPLAIRPVLTAHLQAKHDDLLARQLKQRSSTTQTALARDRAIERTKERLRKLPDTKNFNYSPDSNIQGRDDLNRLIAIEGVGGI